jgi:hypothetical protein
LLVPALAIDVSSGSVRTAPVFGPILPTSRDTAEGGVTVRAIYLDIKIHDIKRSAWSRGQPLIRPSASTWTAGSEANRSPGELGP